MTTKHDSFDSSQDDAFVQSQCDARNMPPRFADAGKLIILVDAFTSRTSFDHEITWDDVYAGHPVNGYLTGPVGSDIPYYQAPGPVGTAMWEYDVSYWRAMQERWASVSGATLSLGIAHMRIYAPPRDAYFAMPLAPSMPPAVANAYGQYHTFDHDGHLERLEALTLQLVQPADGFKAIWSLLMGTAWGNWGAHLVWRDWARETFSNFVGQSWPSYHEPIDYLGHLAGTEPEDLVPSNRWLFRACQIIRAGILGPVEWPWWDKDAWIP